MALREEARRMVPGGQVPGHQGADQGLAQGCGRKQVLPGLLLSLLSPTPSLLFCPHHIPWEAQCQQIEEGLLTLTGGGGGGGGGGCLIHYFRLKSQVLCFRSRGMCTLPSSWLTLCLLLIRTFCDYIRPTWLIQDNLPSQKP